MNNDPLVALLAVVRTVHQGVLLRCPDVSMTGDLLFNYTIHFTHRGLRWCAAVDCRSGAWSLGLLAREDHAILPASKVYMKGTPGDRPFAADVVEWLFQTADDHPSGDPAALWPSLVLTAA